MLKQFWNWLLSLFKKDRKVEETDASFSPLDDVVSPIEKQEEEEFHFGGVIKDKVDSRDYVYTGKDGRMIP